MKIMEKWVKKLATKENNNWLLNFIQLMRPVDFGRFGILFIAGIALAAFFKSQQYINPFLTSLKLSDFTHFISPHLHERMGIYLCE